MEDIDYFKIDEKISENEVLVLVIYDIANDKKRNKLARCLNKYGFRVQKSAFEGTIKRNLYGKLLDELKQFAEDNDSIRIYKLNNDSEIVTYGVDKNRKLDSVIVI